MEITAIEPRRKSFSALYLDGEFAVKIDRETLLRSGYRIGDHLDDEALQELLRQSEQHRADEKALYLLEFRSHSKKELVDKIRRNASEEAAEAAAEKMERLGLLDDEDFARRYGTELLCRKRYSVNRAMYELTRKGIDKELARELCEELAPPAEESIEAILQRKYPRWGEDEAIRRRAAAALQRMGYRYEEIRRVMRSREEAEEYP